MKNMPHVRSKKESINNCSETVPLIISEEKIGLDYSNSYTQTMPNLKVNISKLFQNEKIKYPSSMFTSAYKSSNSDNSSEFASPDSNIDLDFTSSTEIELV